MYTLTPPRTTILETFIIRKIDKHLKIGVFFCLEKKWPEKIKHQCKAYNTIFSTTLKI